MLADADGGMSSDSRGIVGTCAGLAAFADRPARGCEKHRTEALARDAQGRMLIATDGAGVQLLHNDVFGLLEGYPTDTARSARSLLVLADGKVHIGLRDGLLLWEHGRCSRAWSWATSPRKVSVRPRSLRWIRVGRAYGDGLSALQPMAPCGSSRKQAVAQGNVRSVTIDALGRTWASTKFELNRMDPITADSFRVRSFFTVHQGLPNDNVYCTLEDGHGQLSVGKQYVEPAAWFRVRIAHAAELLADLLDLVLLALGLSVLKVARPPSVSAIHSSAKAALDLVEDVRISALPRR